jgi:hypothetical protein
MSHEVFIIFRFKHPLPHSSTPNCHWPHGWDFAGERARPGCRFRRRAKNRPERARPRAQQRGKTVRHRIGECALPSGHCCGRGRPRSDRVRPPQTAIGRTAGTLLGSAPVPVAVFGVAPKTVSQTEWFHPKDGASPARQRVLDCGGKRSATPLLHARKSFVSIIFLDRPKAPSPLPLCRRTPKSSNPNGAGGGAIVNYFTFCLTVSLAGLNLILKQKQTRHRHHGPAFR